ncbi:glycosyltransferase [Shouchella rhizosphaerae]|uniref:Glycosyltransferase n=1 Tax=Shouchella rhizosphaerae TaxID=866786 RepID=A0ABZ2CZZ3_9BACI
MILVTLGTQKFKMNRVISAIDKLYEKKVFKKEEVIIQNGYSKESLYFNCYKMLGREKFDELIEKADIIICHGGTSSIISSLKKQKKVIAIPRDVKFNEHVDNHQFEIVSVFHDQGYIEMVTDVKELGKKLEEIKGKKFKVYEQKGDLARHIVKEIVLKGSH